MNESNYTHIAISVELFQKLFNLISSLPYNQIAGIIKEIESGVQGITLESKENSDTEIKESKETYKS